MAPFLIRRASAADAPAIAGVHVQSWRETYAGLLARAYLDRATSEEARAQREANWRATIERGLETVFVAEQSGEVIAFASLGPARDHPGYSHELMTLYALRRGQGQGIGRALLRAVFGGVREQGGHNLALWVLQTNPTKDWYRAQGAREAGEKVDGSLRETRMVWDPIPA